MKRTFFTCLGLVLVCLASCKREEEIRVYKVAKPGKAAAEAPGGGMGGGDTGGGVAGADPHAGMPGAPPLGGGGQGGDPHAGLTAEQLAGMGSGGGPKVSDTPPSHWVKQATSSMRQASYRVEGDGGASVDISLIILRGAAGGTLDNVNRWRGQVGQEPIDQAALDSSSQKLVTAVGEAVVVDIAGLPAGADAAKDGRIVGAIVNVGGDAWFFKMRGNADLAAKEKDAFLKWAESVKAAPPTAAGASGGGDSAPAAAPPTAPPAGQTPPAAARPKRLDWQVPAGWTEAAGSSMRYATFAIAGADGTKAELAVSSFPGDVGGDLENVNRWRGQVGAEPVTTADLSSVIQKVAAGDKEFSMIDVTGANNRLLAGWARHGTDTWFFKLTGPEALLGAEKEKFTVFLGSVRFKEVEK